jgi:chromosome partitioning protein
MAGSIIVVAQQKGGSGKTTLAAHIAVAWARHGPVALLDLDPQGSLAAWFAARERRLGPGAAGLTLRTGGGWGARRDAVALARDHAVVIVDTPPRADAEAKQAIGFGDLVAVPVQPTPVDLWATASTLRLALGEEVPAMLVLNRVPPRAGTGAAALEAIRASGAKAARAQLGNRVAFAASIGAGATCFETEPSGKAAAEAKAVADELWRARQRDANK